MNKFSKFFIGSLLTIGALSIVNAKSAYIPSQLEQFEKTGICKGCDLSEALLHSHNNADLSNALTVKANFRYTNFYTSNFSNAQMMYANFDNFKASGSKFNSTNLTGADFTSANLSSCDFTGAILNQADLSNADLVRAIISKEQLASAKTLSCTIMPDGTRHAADPGSQCY